MEGLVFAIYIFHDTAEDENAELQSRMKQRRLAELCTDFGWTQAEHFQRYTRHNGSSREMHECVSAGMKVMFIDSLVKMELLYAIDVLRRCSGSGETSDACRCLMAR